jgi:regulation of enolase protein 1 (concanavalin A-like superfamily)
VATHLIPGFPASGALTLQAGPRTDLFVDPRNGSLVLNAPRLLGPVSGDFQLSASVEVDFQATFDAGVLLVFVDDRHWAKLCFEYSPQAEPMVVSVVTRGLSDDCNSFIVDSHQVWLRISRLGEAFAFHASTDAQHWQFVRHFALQAPAALSVGFLAQSPTGEGCAATFDGLDFVAEPLTELRDGS